MESDERKFSFIYSEIIESEDDMIGHIAYSIYKSKKIEYIKNFKKENNRPPSEDDLHNYQMSSKVHLSSIRTQAERLLADFIQFSLAETVEKIEAESKERQLMELRSIVTPLVPDKKKFFDGFFNSLVLSFLKSIILAAIVFLVIFSISARKNFWDAIHNLIPETEIQNNK